MSAVPRTMTVGVRTGPGSLAGASRDTCLMQYRLMNDYSADWPFWGGKEGAGLCGDGDPALPEEIATAARAWAAQFNELFDWQQGWPSAAIAAAHEEEASRLYAEVKRALPDDKVILHYWERAYREDP